MHLCMNLTLKDPPEDTINLIYVGDVDPQERIKTVMERIGDIFG